MKYEDHIDQTIFLIPSGNCIDRSKGSELDQIKTATILKKTRVFVFLAIHEASGRAIEKKLRINNINPNSLIVEGYNGGYKVFASREEIQHYRKAGKAREKLIGELHSLENSELCKIADALEWRL